MHDQDDLSDTESNGLLKGLKKPLRNSYRASRFTRILLAVSISLNISTVILGLVFWFSSKPTTQQTYEHGFVSDLGKEENIRPKEGPMLIYL